MKRITISDKVRAALLQMGLTEKEILVYLVLLEKGALSVQDISRQAQMNRVTIYAALEILKRKGIIAESKKGRRTLFVAEDPDVLRELIEVKKRLIKKEELSLEKVILPTLHSISGSQEQRPRITFYEGVAGINKVYDEYILSCKRKYLIGCGSYDSAMRATSAKEEKIFLGQMRKRKILYKVILEDTPLNRQWAQIGKGLFHVKYLPKGTKVTADVHSFDSFVSLTSYDTLVTTLIEEASIAQSIRIYLEYMWDNL